MSAHSHTCRHVCCHTRLHIWALKSETVVGNTRPSRLCHLSCILACRGAALWTISPMWRPVGEHKRRHCVAHADLPHIWPHLSCLPAQPRDARRREYLLLSADGKRCGHAHRQARLAATRQQNGVREPWLRYTVWRILGKPPVPGKKDRAGRYRRV